MKKLLLVLAPLLILGCQNDDDTLPAAQPTTVSYNFRNMFYPFAASDGINERVTVQMVNGVIVRRMGGLRRMDEASGFPFVFDTTCYDDVLYGTNRIRVEEGKLLTYSTTPSQITDFLVDSQNRITHKIAVHPDDFQTPSDTLKYQYDAQGLLVGTTKNFDDPLRETAAYYYNSQQNLDSIVTRTFYSDALQRTTIEKFTQYDNAPNPLRKLFIFKETFLRSLSRNNFMKYEMASYDHNNELESSEEKNWDIQHDAFGNIIF